MLLDSTETTLYAGQAAKVKLLFGKRNYKKVEKNRNITKVKQIKIEKK
uniref:Uncharacterized protein n=1 Tax=Rhizophora mucronata TaxID=61149 RepID=A0A2P2QV05_RHIMU